MASIEKNSQEALELQKEKIRQVMQEVSSDDQAAVDARKGALYTLLDKMDINEEVVRFKAHLHNLMTHVRAPLPPEKEIIGSQLEKGKQLDFTLQELAREINTIAAKCSDARISASAINVKVAVEKIREQVQNIV
jgi:uncharacterized protein (TIGR00255 family)